MTASLNLVNALLNLTLGATPYTPAENVFVGLLLDPAFDPGTYDPGDPESYDASGYDDAQVDMADELSGNNYGRVEIENNETNWPVTTTGEKTNGTTITFPTAGAGGQGWATHFFIADDDTAGNFMYYGPLSNPIYVNPNSPTTFAPGTLDIAGT